MKTAKRVILIVLLFALMFQMRLISQPQIDATVRGGFVVPEFDTQNRRRSVLFGEEALFITNRIYLIKGLKIETYNDEEQLAWTILAPKCYFNYNNKTAYSDSSLNAQSADGQFAISGEGFEWRQTDSSVTISNNVVTELKLISRSTNAPKNVIRQEFVIKSGRFNFKPRSGEAIYTKDVNLNEIPTRQGQALLLKLQCSELRAKFLQKGSGIETIEAKYNVSIQQGTNTASALSAIYYATNDQIHLSGSPKWSTTEAEGVADLVILDRKNNRFIANGHTFTRTKGAVAQTFGFELFETNNVSKTNVSVQIFSDKLTVNLPPQGKTIQHLDAEGKVRIVQADSYIQAEQAQYNWSTNEIAFEFYKNVEWRSKALSGKTDLLKIDKLKNSFIGKGNVYVAFEQASKTNKDFALTNVSKIEVYADQFLFQSNKVDFVGNIKLKNNAFVIECSELTLKLSPKNLLQGLIARQRVKAQQNLNNLNSLTNGYWKLECDLLEATIRADGQNPEKIVTLGNVQAAHCAKYSSAEGFENLLINCGDAAFLFAEKTNALKSVAASNDVYIVQKKISTNGIIYTNITLRCDQLEAELSQNGRYVNSAKASHNVVVEQNGTPGILSPPLRLRAQYAYLQNFQNTNIIDYIFVTNNVVVEYGKTFAIAREAFFTGTNELVKLNGNPLLKMNTPGKTTNQPPRNIEVSSADSLLWFRTENRFQATGPYQVKILIDETDRKRFEAFRK
jgi:lipopolysaccharide export system protein LptA